MIKDRVSKDRLHVLGCYFWRLIIAWRSQMLPTITRQINLRIAKLLWPILRQQQQRLIRISSLLNEPVPSSREWIILLATKWGWAFQHG